MKIEEEVLFAIDGLQVKKGRTYLVKDRQDGDAPSGFVNAHVSKLPADGVGESYPVPFLPATPGSTKGAWDTGFYKDSPCYKNIDIKEVQVIVKARTEKVLKPYRTAVGDPNALEHSDLASLDNASFHIWSGKTYNTEDPLEVMALYIALLGKQAAPMGEEGAAKYRNCFYVIADTSKVTKDKDEKNVGIMRAVMLFSTMFDSDKESLDVVLKWTNLGKFSINADRDTVSSVFYETIKDSLPKCKAFVEASDDMQNQMHKEKMYIFCKLKESKGRNTKFFTAANGTLFYEDHELGGDLKTASENIARNPDLAAVKMEILTGEEMNTTKEQDN